MGLLHSDIPISTTISNTARFPFLSPAGELTPSPDAHVSASAAQIIDGGYFENEGMQTAIELARWLHDYGPSMTGGRPVAPIIVQASADADTVANNPDIDPGLHENEIVRCGTKFHDDPNFPAGGDRPLQLLVPVSGISSVRGGHSAVVLREARREFCGYRRGDQSFFHFYLYKPKSGEVPLNWVLSRKIADYIWQSLTVPDKNPDAKEFKTLSAVMLHDVRKQETALR